ncbi:hypothetical protein CLOM_g17861 [Closterium sp. NIES-68]|nr:hypothetical protein CLOM_g17861 [Closterium sp. NIES-68]GJP78420.1 hypothetical protein CLOP_g8718 [Closterium sp. NIES-67]
MATPSVAPLSSKVIRSRVDDVEIRALEGKLELLNIQRQLSAVRCENFIHMLQSSLQHAGDDDDDLALDLGDLPVRRSTIPSRRSFEVSARHSHLSEDFAYLDGASDLSRSRSNPSASTPLTRSLGSRSARSSTSSPGGLTTRSLRRHASLNARRNNIFR